MKNALKILSTTIAALCMVSCSSKPTNQDSNHTAAAEINVENAKVHDAQPLANKSSLKSLQIHGIAKHSTSHSAHESTSKKWWETTSKTQNSNVVKAPAACNKCGSKYCSKPNKCKSPYKNKYYNTTMQGSSGQRNLGLVPTMKTLTTD